MVVVGHDGDDKLGGKDYDWALVDVLINRLTSEYRNLALSRDGSTRRPMAKLKYVVEDAKKALSLLPTVNVEVNRLGGGFDDVDTVVQLTRSDLEKATEHLTGRCISICRRLMNQVRLSSDDLAAVLVVGGQTQTPYIREMVATELGKADFRLDPLTVVASGAALFASTQRIPSRAPKQVPAGSVEVRLAYSPVSTDLDAEIGIAVRPVISGATVAVLRNDGGWSSGAIVVPPSGKIQTTVALRAKKTNTFDVQLRDASGGLIPTAQTAFSITHGLAIAQATTSRAFGVALENNVAQIIIPNGSPLPAKGTQQFVTAHDVAAGNERSALKIYVLEGDNPRADRNIKVGEIILSGNEIRRSLGAGETVEVTYRLDESKTLSAEALFPSLREVRQMVYRPERPELHTADIELEIRKERERLAEIERAAPAKLGSQIGRLIAQVEHEKDAAHDDHDTRQKAAHQMIEAKQAIDDLERSSEWELLIATLEGYRESTKSIVEAHGSPEQGRDYPQIVKAADDALARHNIAALRQAVENLRDLYWSIALAQDDFWKAQFAQLCEETDFVDPLNAERLKEEGMRAFKRDDMRSLRTIIRDLHRLLPSWQQGKLDLRFADAGLRKAPGQSS